MTRIPFMAALAAAVLAAGCTSAPIYNVEGAPAGTLSGQQLTPEQVRGAIVAAGSNLGWYVVDAGPGKLEGRLYLRSHTAIVEIPYSATRYSIELKTTYNLDEGWGWVHRNYNSWVQNLDRNIQTQLSRL